MDVFTPASANFPVSRMGGPASVVAVKMDAGTDTRRLKRQRSPLAIKLRFYAHKSEIQTDYDFIEAKSGHAPFKFKDPWYHAITAEAVGTGDGSRTIFYLDEKYIESSSLTVKLDGTPTSNYTLSNEEGKITFTTAPGNGVAITADYEFYRKFYFDILDPSKELELITQSAGFWSFEISLKESLV